MVVLFIHGMGRSPVSGWLLLFRLRCAGFRTSTFGYSAAFEDFDSITSRLAAKISELGKTGEYILVGQSLGGVLLRAAVNSLPKGFLPPHHLFLLGSPLVASRLAIRLKGNILFRAFAGDCGQLLGSPDRMKRIGAISSPTTGIAGVRGISGWYSPFGSEANDGVVSVSEVVAPWLSNQLEVPVIHTLLPSSSIVANIILREVVQTAS